MKRRDGIEMRSGQERAEESRRKERRQQYGKA